MNPRNVVLCLLEIARIACTKHSFSPAPGLVQFEQEIDEMELMAGLCPRCQTNAILGATGVRAHLSTVLMALAMV